MHLILASGSAARAALLAAAGLAFEARPAPVDEAALKAACRAEGLSAQDAAVVLADVKAARIGRRAPEAVVIGADQILVCEGRWFDRPADAAEARAHLEALRGREHALATAVVGWRDGRRAWYHVATPRLRMRAFSDAVLEDHLAREADHLTATVGAYRLEGPGIRLFAAVEGEHAAVLGLPMLPLLAWLRDTGVLPR